MEGSYINLQTVNIILKNSAFQQECFAIMNKSDSFAISAKKKIKEDLT